MKQDLARLKRECQETKLQHCVKAARVSDTSSANYSEQFVALLQLTIHCAALARKNALLLKALEPYDGFEDAIRQQRHLYGYRLFDDPSPRSILKGSGELGWNVNLLDGSPSLHFHPYSAQEFNDI